MTTPPAFEAASSLAAFHDRQLDWLQTMTRGGSELAPAAALFYCAKHGIAVPDWLVHSASVGYVKALAGTLTKTIGRSSGPVERYLQDMIDYVRWDAVDDVRKRQIEFAAEVEDLRSRPNIPKSVLEEKTSKLMRVGHNWLHAFECAATFQVGTPALGGAAAMKASYYRLKKNSESGTLRYHLLDPDFLRSIGIEHPMFWRTVRKVTRKYNQTN